MSRPQPVGESSNTELGEVEVEDHKPAKSTTVSKLRRKSDSPRDKVTGQKENKRPSNRTQSSSPIVLRAGKTTKQILKDSNIPPKPCIKSSRNSVLQTKFMSNVKKPQPHLKHTLPKPALQEECASHPIIADGDQSPSSHDESDLEIIEVRAVDKVVKDEGSEEEVSDEADDIVSQVLGGERRHIKPTVERYREKLISCE